MATELKKSPFYINNPENRLPRNRTDDILKKSEPLQYHRTLQAYSPTPLHHLKNLARELQVKDLYVKDESYRFGLNAFKALGASYAIHRILENNPTIETFCTATDGNHGRAVAWAAAMAGKQSRIFVPVDTTAARIEAISREGGIVEKVSGQYEEACDLAKKSSSENGWQLVQDTATTEYEQIPAYIKAGYLTHFHELEDSIHNYPEPEIDLVFLQSGVGSWPAAAAWYYQNRYGKKRPKLVIVEPTEAAGFLESVRNGKLTSPVGSFKTMMAGLNCGIPSSSAFEILWTTIDCAIAVEDHFMEEAIRKLYYPVGDDPVVISGESGAGGMAGLLAILKDERFAEVRSSLGINQTTRILLINTEGATDPENFQNIIKK